MNTAPIRKIRLSGILGKKFAKEFTYRARDVPHAIRALKGQFPGFERFMNEANQKGLTFAVFVGKKNVAEEEIDMTKGTEDIHIVPVVIGSKRGGLFQTILGVALIAAATIATGGAAIGLGAGFAAAGGWGTAALIGGSMVLGGVVQMLSPQPGGLSISQNAENKPSYAFGGPINSIAQGNPVGVLYGTREIGGAVISAGIYTEDQQ
ncbi:tail assembly protein [Serratia aquatilis]|uniref:Tail assembly protein n=1 Tax=Serratia aquatilis TaxID=1737515 RepID=A0ABV6E9L4_9GAMM